MLHSHGNASQEETMVRLLIAGFMFVVMALWTWYNYVGS